MVSTSKNIMGIGINKGNIPTKINGSTTREYNMWIGMLRRCTEKRWVTHPTYMGTNCSENFKNYNFFHSWCTEQIGFDAVDEMGNTWQLDKDILLRGNRTYSESVCCFVPQRINSLLTKSNKSRGYYPIGVFFDKARNKIKAQCNNGSIKVYLGSFNTPQEAFQAYKTYKEALIKEVANEYKEQLDYRVYEALMNYEVNEND